MLAEEKYTSELYAIKVLKKRFIIDNDEVERLVHLGCQIVKNAIPFYLHLDLSIVPVQKSEFSKLQTESVIHS